MYQSLQISPVFQTQVQVTLESINKLMFLLKSSILVILHITITY